MIGLLLLFHYFFLLFVLPVFYLLFFLFVFFSLFLLLCHNCYYFPAIFFFPFFPILLSTLTPNQLMLGHIPSARKKAGAPRRWNIYWVSAASRIAITGSDETLDHRGCNCGMPMPALPNARHSNPRRPRFGCCGAAAVAPHPPRSRYRNEHIHRHRSAVQAAYCSERQDAIRTWAHPPTAADQRRVAPRAAARARPVPPFRRRAGGGRGFIGTTRAYSIWQSIATRRPREPRSGKRGRPRAR